MINWQNVKLGEIVKLQQGFALNKKSNHYLSYEKNGIPLLKISDLLNDTQSLFVKNNIPKQFIANENDIIYSRTGQVGHAFINKKGVVYNNCFKVIVNKKVDKNFLYFFLNTPDIRAVAKSLATGTAQPDLNHDAFKSIKINLPSLSTQQKIAKILSNYDDLIENNLKRIKLLEESARLTYEEWFLRYKIKGKKLNIDQTSSLPFNWKKIKIKNYVATISKGPSLNYDLGTSKGVEVLNQSCIRNGEIELEKVLIARELSENKKAAYLKVNDILINSMGQGTLGRVSKNVSVYKKMIIHNCITFLRAKDKFSQFMLFYFISSHQKYFEIVAHGSTGQSTLKKDLISNLMITLPDDKTLKSFDLIVGSLWNKIGTLKKQNLLLKEAQSILLPRLMTGSIDTDNMKLLYEH